jgi:hypothetical protein
MTGFRLLSAALASALSASLCCTTAVAVELSNPWVTSAAKPYGQPCPDVWSIEALHADPAFAGLAPKEFCRTLYNIYYDGRRKDWNQFQAGMTLWSHTAQEPRVNAGLIELDPVLLLNVFGSGYCGIQSGMLEGIWQSRPGGKPGQPAIEARRWFLGGIVHSVAEAFYDGGWHYYDIDIGGWAGDAKRDAWSIPDILADRKGFYGAKTTLRAPYFFKADSDGAWVEKIDAKKTYAFQDNHMLGHSMNLSLREGETFTRWFSAKAAGWSEFAPPTLKPDTIGRGFCELVYAPKDKSQVEADALSKTGKALILSVRCPYTITSSVVTGTGTLSVSNDLGRSWVPLPADGSVAAAVNHWDYLLKVEDGSVTRIVTRGMLHPGSLPRIGSAATTMSVSSKVPESVLTWIPDWSSAEAFAATTQVEGMTYKPCPQVSFSGGPAGGSGSITIPVQAPPGCRLTRLSVCAIGGTGSTPSPDKAIELALGPAGKSTLVARTTDCSPWGTKAESKVEHWQNNVNGSASFAPCAEAEVKLSCRGWGEIRGLRIYAGYVRETSTPTTGSLVVTHGYDGKTFSHSIPAAELTKGATYTVPEGAKVNEFVRMEWNPASAR